MKTKVDFTGILLGVTLSLATAFIMWSWGYNVGFSRGVEGKEYELDKVGDAYDIEGKFEKDGLHWKYVAAK